MFSAYDVRGKNRALKRLHKRAETKGVESMARKKGNIYFIDTEQTLKTTNKANE